MNEDRCSSILKPTYRITYDLGTGVSQTILVCARCFQKDEWHNHVLNIEIFNEEFDIIFFTHNFKAVALSYL